MDHGHHDHSAHASMDMGHGDMGDRCSMNMLFTWDPTNLCIIFRSWHVRGTVSLVFSLLAIVALTAGYEFVREISRQYEARLEAKRGVLRREGTGGTTIKKDGQLIKALLYALQVFYSFFIMLLFMTYNGWVMLAVAVGAFVGYMIWGNTSAVKSVACH
ncbi:uncharacterized protein DFL_004154 [Arthrobotrys flagrans]|uniref:Copper transport protein n=1 Tax=Arthrobotrys flagrans TaxID=97331 RepID=A0A437A3Z6_ARTFL|nr:hypothetical protein DFL_004154 [Arthrobotrys flagrans]